MKIERLLAIIVHLLNHGRISASILAQRFEVSIRTIHRDMEAINRSGVPIVSYQGNGGGFEIMSGYRLSHQILRREDLYSIIAGLRGIQSQWSDQSIVGTIDKMRNLLHKTETTHNWNEDELIIDLSPWGNNNEEKQTVVFLREAIKRKNVVRFEYTNSQCNDVLNAYQLLKEKGVRIDVEIQNPAGNYYEFFIMDPDENRIRIHGLLN